MTARFYRKLPIVIEAWQLTEDNLWDVLEWADSKPYFSPTDPETHANGGPHTFLDGLSIFTLEGRMKADFGDYVIRGIKGEFYPCKPEIFEATYEIAGGES
jgi:hypothetical protein